MKIPHLYLPLSILLALSVGSPSKAADLFDKSNLAAWCIVPFDAKKRSPEERAEMVAKMGIKKIAYDWRQEHVAEFEREIAHGSLYVGSPETVARKIAGTVKTLGASRFDMKYSAGPLPHAKMMRCIELYGRRVAPLVREMAGAAAG